MGLTQTAAAVAAIDGRECAAHVRRALPSAYLHPCPARQLHLALWVDRGGIRTFSYDGSSRASGQFGCGPDRTMNGR
jgi:hypothetical protein